MEKDEINITQGWIGVISDTHVPRRASCLPPVLFDLMDGATLLLHAGDLVEEKVIDELKALAPVVAVAGNMDPPPLQNRLAKEKIINLNGKKLALVHGTGRGAVTLEWAYSTYSGKGLHGVIFGHVHEPVMEYRDEFLLFSPGSPTDPRGNSRPSCGKLWLEKGKVCGKIINI